MNTFDLALDLDKRAGVTQWVTLRQGDHNGTVLKATIYDHGVQVGGGYTCRVSIRIAGSGDEYYRETANYSNGVATVTIDEQYAAAVVGITYGYFELLQGSAVIASTESFGVRVLQSAQEGAVPGDKYDSAIEDALAELDEATGRISQMVVDATEEYLEAHPEITTTVQDNSLTDAKLVQRGGILSRVERLWYRLANLLTATPAEADVLTVSDAAKTPLAGLSLYGRSTQDGTPTPDAPVAIESVGPNLAVTPYTHFDFAPSRGVTYSRNADGSITASGTSTSYAYLGLCNQSDNPFGLERGKTYTLVCSSSKVTVMTVAGGSTRFMSSVITIPESGDWTVGVGLVTGIEIEETFRFSVFEGDVLAPSAVPYGCVGLLAMGRNMLFANGVGASGGVTYTLADDGTVAMDGTATGNSTLYVSNRPTPIVAGTYVLSGCPAGGSSSTWYLRLVVVTKDNATLRRYEDVGSGVTVTINDGEYFTCFFHASKGDAMTGKVLRPMLERGSTATPYQPYAESVIPIDLGGRSLRSLPDGTRDEVTVDEYGHAVLTQRVDEITFDGTEAWIANTARGENVFYRNVPGRQSSPPLLDRFAPAASVSMLVGTTGMAAYGGYNPNSRVTTLNLSFPSGVNTVALAQQWLADNPTTLLYALATPVTIDLGTVDPIPLQGPDMTAQAVPTAPFELTYERDLNVTLARLEASIAEVATA